MKDPGFVPGSIGWVIGFFMAYIIRQINIVVSFPEQLKALKIYQGNYAKVSKENLSEWQELPRKISEMVESGSAVPRFNFISRYWMCKKITSLIKDIEMHQSCLVIRIGVAEARKRQTAVESAVNDEVPKHARSAEEQTGPEAARESELKASEVAVEPEEIKTSASLSPLQFPELEEIANSASLSGLQIPEEIKTSVSLSLSSVPLSLLQFPELEEIANSASLSGLQIPEKYMGKMDVDICPMDSSMDMDIYRPMGKMDVDICPMDSSMDMDIYRPMNRLMVTDSAMAMNNPIAMDIRPMTMNIRFDKIPKPYMDNMAMHIRFPNICEICNGFYSRFMEILEHINIDISGRKQLASLEDLAMEIERSIPIKIKKERINCTSDDNGSVVEAWIEQLAEVLGRAHDMNRKYKDRFIYNPKARKRISGLTSEINTLLKLGQVNIILCFNN